MLGQLVDLVSGPVEFLRGFAPWAAVVMATYAAVAVAVGRRKRDRERRRGFEVKLNAGPTPVLREKDNDHG